MRTGWGWSLGRPFFCAFPPELKATPAGRLVVELLEVRAKNHEPNGLRIFHPLDGTSMFCGFSRWPLVEAGGTMEVG